MISIRRYLLLLISLAGMALSNDCRFSKKDIATFLKYIFNLHNGVRFKHFVPPLLRTEKLERIALKIMDKMYNDEYFSSDKYGVYYSAMQYDDNTQLDVEEAKKFFLTWYEQGNFYDYNNEPFEYNAVNGFTQIMWMETTMIGLTFRCENNRYIVLAVYDPPGNVIGEYTRNVHRPRSDRQIFDPENIRLNYKTETEKFIENITELHNNARFKHGARSLIHDIDLDPIACSLLKNGQKSHFMFGVNWLEIEFDENIKLGDEALANEVFSRWYNKVKKYDSYNDEPLDNNADSFTQIVWYNTERIGICYIKNYFGTYQFLVLYAPPGNIPGEYADNVFMPQSLEEEGSSENN